MSQGRRERRTIRRVEPRSVLKFSALLYVCLFVMLLVAGVILWVVGGATGARQAVERFFGDLLGSKDFHLLGDKLLAGAVVGGAVLVVVGTAANTLLAVLYNLISDVLGGIDVTLTDDDEPPRP